MNQNLQAIEQSLRIITAALLTLSLIASPTVTMADQLQQRERRSTERSTNTLPPGIANSQILPVRTILTLQLETKLDSRSSRPADRFRSRLIEAISDASGRELIPQGVIVEGYIESVTPAQLRRRSGIIAVRFDTLHMPDGRALPLEGTLTAADPKERQRIDEEGNVSGSSTINQSIVFIGGGAGAGAAIGMIAGGAILGAGVGAVAGIFGAWLAKGKEAVVEPGTRIGLQLSKPLDLSLGASGIVRLDSHQPVDNDPVKGKSPNTSTLLRVSSVRAERGPNGAVRVSITAETPSTGWRVYADHALDRETLEVWLRGKSPQSASAQLISHPTVAITVPDDAQVIRRVMIHGTNGEQVIELQPATIAPDPSFSELSARIADKIEMLVGDYASLVGAKRRPEGKYDLKGERQLRDEEVALLFALSNLSDSVQLFHGILAANSSLKNHRDGASRLMTHTEEVARRWEIAQPGPNLDRKWHAIEKEIRLLVEMVR